MKLEPVKLLPNRVWRTYRGGKCMEIWKGSPNPVDGSYPEEWIASVVSARNPGREHVVGEGLSRIDDNSRRSISLKQFIDADAERILGSSHVKKFGCNTGVLVKALDSCERLTLQVHPDRIASRDIFKSPFGKTEAWLIIAGRKINGEDPYILLGFKPGVTRKRWERLFWEQDREKMVDSLHKFRIEPGQVFLIEGGVPHAIGPGCFLMEIQEPTDYTIRVERQTPEGLDIPDILIHQGAGFERMFDCFKYETYSPEEVLDKWCIKPQTVHLSENGSEEVLIDYSMTPCFAMNYLKVYDWLDFSERGTFSVVVIMSGAGTLLWEDGSMDVEQGDQIFIPACVREVKCRNRKQQPMKLIRCFPPNNEFT